MAYKVKKDHHAWTTRAILFGGVISALLLAGSFFTPWRFTSILDTGPFKGFFTVDRNYMLMSASDKTAAAIPWSKIKSDMCSKYNKMQSAQNTAGTAVLNMAGDIAGMGGAIVGCSAWPLCINHAALRCYQFKLFVPATMLAAGAVGIGAILSLCTIALYYNQGNDKKKLGQKQRHKVEEAKKWTFVCAVLAFLLPFLGGAVWIFMTDMMLQRFMAKVFYPWARLNTGFFLWSLNICVSYNTCCFACWNYWPEVFPCYKKPREKDGGGEDNDALMNRGEDGEW